MLGLDLAQSDPRSRGAGERALARGARSVLRRVGPV